MQQVLGYDKLRSNCMLQQHHSSSNGILKACYNVNAFNNAYTQGVTYTDSLRMPYYVMVVNIVKLRPREILLSVMA